MNRPQRHGVRCLKLHARFPEGRKPLQEWSQRTVIPKKGLPIILDPRVQWDDEPRLLIVLNPGVIGLYGCREFFIPDGGL